LHFKIITINNRSPQVAIALLNSKGNIILQLTRVLDVANIIGRKDERLAPVLPTDAALVAEVMKKYLSLHRLQELFF